MRVTTWKGVGLAAVVVTVGSSLILTGNLVGAAGGGTSVVSGCEPNQQNHEAYIKEAKAVVYDERRGHWDSQVLYWSRDRTKPGPEKDPGPDAKIWPAMGGHNGTIDQNGRFLARIWVDPDHQDPQHGRKGYPKLKLPPGTSWVKICKTGNAITGLIVPEDTKNYKLRRVGRLDEPPRGKWDHPRAIWEEVPEDDHACFTCGGARWCRMF